MRNKTSKATTANQRAAIEYAMEVFKQMEQNSDVFPEYASNRQIAKTLNAKNILTRTGKKWQTTSVTRLMKYRHHFKGSQSNRSSLTKFF